MEQERSNTASRKGKHFSRNERILMEGFLRAGMTGSEIAKDLILVMMRHVAHSIN